MVERDFFAASAFEAEYGRRAHGGCEVCRPRKEHIESEDRLSKPTICEGVGAVCASASSDTTPARALFGEAQALSKERGESPAAE